MSNEASDEADIKLTEKQNLFVLEYIIDFNATRAAKDAGYSEDTARMIGYENLTKPYIQKAIQKAINERKERLNIDADKVLSMWWQMATADYNEITSVVHEACEFCHEENKDEDSPAYNPEINNDCLVCHGKGSPRVVIADTSKLSPEARLIYQGVEQTKTGLKVLTTDRMKALDNVARHLGMFKETVNHISEDGSMSPKKEVDLSGLSDDELRALSAIATKSQVNQGGVSET